MKRRKSWMTGLAIGLVLCTVLSVLAPVLSLLAGTQSNDNIEHLMACGLPEDKAAALAQELDYMGVGELVGIDTEDNGEGYDLMMYDENGGIWYAGVDYYGNLVGIGDDIE